MKLAAQDYDDKHVVWFGRRYCTAPLEERPSTLLARNSLRMKTERLDSIYVAREAFPLCLDFLNANVLG